MRVLRHLGFATLVAVMALGAQGENSPFPVVRQKTASFSRDIDPGATIVLDNPNGTVIVTGHDEPKVDVEAVIAVSGADDNAVKTGFARVNLLTSGDTSRRSIRTSGPLSGFAGRWSVNVSYRVNVPRSCNVSIETINSNLIQVSNVDGLIAIKNFAGRIDVTTAGSPVIVDTVNGNIKLRMEKRFGNDVRLTSVNGLIEVEVPRRASFRWRAETMKGDVIAPASIQGEVTNSGGARIWQATVGRRPGPTLLTSTITGTVRLLEAGAPVSTAQSVFPATVQPGPAEASADLDEFRDLLSQPTTASSYVLQRTILRQDLRFETRLGSVFLGDVRGNIDVTTHAGEIVVARVIGRCDVQSFGGPLNLGEIWGNLNAKTAAGDIAIGSVLKGGSAVTGGGNILVDKVSGPLILRSGGGDITVRELASSLRAYSRSGDILVGIDPSLRKAGIELRTIGGNVILAIPSGFGADIDATILVKDEKAHSLESLIPGLTFVRKQVDGRTSIQATGSINGGGEKVVLYAEEGNIQIRKR